MQKTQVIERIDPLDSGVQRLRSFVMVLADGRRVACQGEAFFHQKNTAKSQGRHL